MSTQNLDSADLKGVGRDGLIHEDVMNQLWDISRIPLPLTDVIGTDTVKNSYASWVTDRLNAPDLTNAQIDGSDQTGNNTNPDEDGNVTSDGEPLRQGNHCQISTKVVRVSTRARESNTIGKADELSYQVMQRQRECRRDVEAIQCSSQASVADDGATTAGQSAGLGAWIQKNFDGGVGGSAGGFNASTGLVDAPTEGTTRALTETAVRDICQAVYEEGGNPTYGMSVPSMVRQFSNYLFTSSARIATLTSETGQAREAAVAKGAVNVFVTDFGVVLELVSNRIMQPLVSTPGSEDTPFYVLDPDYLRLGYLHGYRTEELAKLGLADNRQICVDWTLKVLSQRAQGQIRNLDYTLPVTES